MRKYPIHPELQIITKFKLPLQPTLGTPINNFLQMSFDSMKTPPGIKVTKRTIRGYQNGLVNLTIFEPSDTTEKLPCLVYYHGGAFSMKASPHHKTLICEYALRTPCKVVFVDYHLVPKHPFPCAVEDAYQSYCTVVENAETLNIDHHKIAVGGDSAGGNLATVVCLLARDRNVPIPSFQFLIYPCTDARQITTSMQEYTDTPIWNSVLNKKMWERYLKNGFPISKEYASPIEAESLQHCPPTFIEVAEFDCLHDEGIAYAKKLQEFEVPVELVETKQTFHAFDTLTSTPFVKEIINHRIQVLQKAFKD